MTLSGKQKRYLRALGQGIPAALVVGRQGVTDATIQAAMECFNRRELLKVRIRGRDASERRKLGQHLAERTEAHLVQVLGQVALLYRPAPEGSERQDRIQLPDSLFS